MISIYTVTSERDGTAQKDGGYIELEYLDGVFNAFKVYFNKVLTPTQFKYLVENLPYDETKIHQLEEIGLKVGQTPTNVKVAMFCAAYKERHNGNTYKITPAEIGKLKRLNFKFEEVRAYFKSKNYLIEKYHSVANFVNQYNIVLAEIVAESAPAVSPHPDHYDRKYEGKLTDKQKPEYWSHLRSKGLKAKKNRIGEVTDWIKNTDDEQTGN